jgi:hypothetical protein
MASLGRGGTSLSLSLEFLHFVVSQVGKMVAQASACDWSGLSTLLWGGL